MGPSVGRVQDNGPMVLHICLSVSLSVSLSGGGSANPTTTFHDEVVARHDVLELPS